MNPFALEKPNKKYKWP